MKNEKEPSHFDNYRDMSVRLKKDYETIFGFKSDELAGKHVLDLGAGFLEMFSRESATGNVDVISLNPKLVNVRLRKQTIHNFSKIRGSKNPIPDWRRKSVAGTAQDLPFSDHVFDAIIAVASITKHVPEKDWPQALAQITRTLKPSGTVYIYPVKNVESFEALLISSGITPMNLKSKYVENQNDQGFAIEFMIK